MTTGLLFTYPFSDRDLVREEDPEWVYAICVERGMRELGYRAYLEQNATAESAPFFEVSLAERIPARDAGDVCGVCGDLVTWVDHLPPVDPYSPVRCLKNVSDIRRNVVVDDVFPGVSV